jgi:cellulose synthase/poly-beta-1,6-N-acetylglucosamine synthase-like glycosyltransferase
MITEDIEMSTRLQDEGHYVRYAPDAVVYTEGPSDFTGLCKQRLRWKYGRFLTFLKYKHLFFSFKKKHNFFLSYIILPISLLGELLLFFEGILLVAFYVYTFYTHDFVPLAVVIVALTAIISLQILSDSNVKDHKNLFWLTPGAWIIFYIMDFVEYQALIKSIIRLIKKQAPTWQRWERVGVFNNK